MAEERVQRRLAAILAADVVGFSREMERDELGTLATLKDRQKTILEPLVARHHGRIVKLMGDGVLLEFASAVNAVQCAIDLQTETAAANTGLPTERAIVLRIGVNLGDVLVEGSDIHGDGVNVASRLEAIAEPGSILVSAAVREQVERSLPVAFDDMGEQSLKNISRPIRVHRLRGMARSASASTAGVLALPNKPSVAVLAFDNMSGDPEQQYFSDGITEDIITELSRYRSLFIIARNSSFQYRGKAVDAKQIGRDLGVAYLVEGSVRKAGDRVRVTAQLIEAKSGNHVWAERFDRVLADIFAVQDEVVQTIAARLAVRVENEELERLRRSGPQDMRAYDLCLRAWRSADLMTAESTNEALALFHEAIAIDPSYARAYAGLAWTFGEFASYSAYSDRSANVPQLRDEALRCGLKAVALDDTDSKPHTILGWVYHQRRDFDVSRRHLDRALQLNPNDADGLILRSLLLTLAGDATAGVDCAEQAIRLNPYHPGYYLGVLAAGYFFNRNYAEAARLREKVAHGFPEHHASRAAAYALAGDHNKAKESLAEFLKRAPAYWKEPPTTRLIADMFVFRRSEDEALYLEGLRKAGLPE